jgi:hypothetical protein
MADRKRLLGVFIPAKKRQERTQEPVEETVPVGPPPPFSTERCAELEAGGPNYDAMSEESLKRRMVLRKIGLRGRPKTEHKIKTLRVADARDMKR